ncbi:MAG: ABC transporter ATP-binding protein [Planctomycetota bacterium]
MEGNTSKSVNESTVGHNAVLYFEGVSRVYGIGEKAVRALGPVQFEARAGELLAVMGPSGSGKTTLLSLAGALDRPTAGRVWVHGNDLDLYSTKQLAELRRRSIGYVFQDLNLLPGLTALENVALPLELDGVPLKAARAEADGSLERVHLKHLANRFPDDLSGGEQQRVAIARAFVGPRTLLLADEPTGALDSVAGEIVMRLLRLHCDAGQTAILVTHDATHAAWADRVLFLRDGRIVDEATSTGIRAGAQMC